MTGKPRLERAVGRYERHVSQGNEMVDSASIARLYQKGACWPRISPSASTTRRSAFIAFPSEREHR